MVKIDEPFHGAVLNWRHGTPVEGGLRVTVKGTSSLRDRVTLNGQAMDRTGTEFRGSLVLREKETDLVAVAEGPRGRSEHRIRVVWDRNSYPRYRFSIDDNSFFLRDIAQNHYGSLFDCFYLAGLRDLNQRYGAKFVLNIYYTTGDGFELSQFPDRYRREWADHAHWLKLAFHAYQDQPDRPYQYASGEKLAADFDRVGEQILRFAGDLTYSPPTVIHWAMVPPAAWGVLVERGVRVLSAIPAFRGGAWDTQYFLDDSRSEYLSRHDALKDFASGIVFSNVDMICNNTPLDRIVPTLEPLRGDPNRAEIMDLFTHEQYFWPFYSHHVPDHFQRLDAALRWVTENGYEPVFFHQGFLGNPEG